MRISILLRKIVCKIRIATGNCAGWLTIDKDLFTENPKEFEELQTLNKSGIFSDSNIQYKKEGTIFLIRGGRNIYKGDGSTSKKVLINSEQGVFVFIRSSDPQAKGKGRKKRGDTIRHINQPHKCRTIKQF